MSKTERSERAEEAISQLPEVSVPRSQQKSIADLTHEVESLDASVAEIRERSEGGKRTAASENVKRTKQLLQGRINESAKRLQRVHKPNGHTPELLDMTQLVWIRAMISHHPPPVLGEFSFVDIYMSYVEGMKYLVPKYVAVALEENENAVMLS